MNTSSITFTLPTSLTIRTATETLQDMLAIVPDEKEGIVLQGDEVEEISTPGLQLLTACWQQAQQQHYPFHLTDPSQALKDALACAGLGYLLD